MSSRKLSKSASSLLLLGLWLTSAYASRQLLQCPTYTVKAGDTFSTIATAQGTTVAALQSANPSLSPTSLQIGQPINLPCSSSTSTTPSTPSTPSGSGVSITSDQFVRALTVNGFPVPADSKRLGMLNAIQQMGGSAAISSNRELAMFLAEVEQETGGLQQLTEAGVGTSPPFVGRGYLQLTGQSNYAAASQAIFGNSAFLVNNYGLVASNETLAWETAVWYWKTYVHSLVQTGQFGAATNAINGPIECRVTPQPASAQRRCNYYKAILPILSPSSTADCSGCGSTSRKL